MTSVGASALGAPRIEATLGTPPDSTVRNPEVSTSAFGFAPRAIPLGSADRAAARCYHRDRLFDLAHKLHGTRKIDVGVCHQNGEAASEVSIARSHQLVADRSVDLSIWPRVYQPIAARHEDDAGNGRTWPQ